MEYIFLSLRNHYQNYIGYRKKSQVYGGFFLQKKQGIARKTGGEKISQNVVFFR